MKIPVTVTTFPELISYLIDEEHEGVGLRMAQALGVSTALVYQWAGGSVRRPSDASITKIAMYYDIDPLTILALTYERTQAARITVKPISGGMWPIVAQYVANNVTRIPLPGSWPLAILGWLHALATSRCVLTFPGTFCHAHG